MRNEKGQFIKGVHASPKTEFKKGQHWRPKKLHWDRNWLYDQYIVLEKSVPDIAREQNISVGAVMHWMKKHKIERRRMSKVRDVKYWGQCGENNPMFGKRSWNWKGGITPERQAFYSSLEWKSTIRKVWDRDRGICTRCGKIGKQIHIHHVVSFSVIKLRTSLSNLVTLCIPCHHFVHSNQNSKLEFISDAKG